VFNIGLPELLIVLVIVGVTVLPASRICAKAGYPAWRGVVAIVPVANIVLVFFLAFVKWPIERQLEAARRGSAPSQ
jgi:hypothetical protein